MPFPLMWQLTISLYILANWEVANICNNKTAPQYTITYSYIWKLLFSLHTSVSSLHVEITNAIFCIYFTAQLHIINKSNNRNYCN